MKTYTEQIDRYAEIPAGATGTITATGSTFQFGEDEITPIVKIVDDQAYILGGTVTVPTTAIRVI